MDRLIAFPTPDGRWIALSPAEFAAGIARAAEIVPGAVPSPSPSPEIGSPTTGRLLTSAQMAEILGVHATKVESMAANKEIPSKRVGKLLRFVPDEVIAALPENKERSK